MPDLPMIMPVVPLPKSVVVFPDPDKPDVVETIVSGLQANLPELSVQIGGAAPGGPYAVIEFIPDDMTPYRDASWVHISGAGANGMLAALRRDCVSPSLITRTVGEMGQQIGEYVLSYWLADLQKHATRAALQVAKNWDQNRARPERPKDRKALIFGTGGIGSGVAKVLKSVGANCTGVSRSGQARAPFDHILAIGDLPDDMTDYDLCVAVLPNTDATRGAINASIFARLDAVLFINAGRGPTVDTDAMRQALKAGHLRGAILDVFDTEPLPDDSDLWHYPCVTVTPHISGLTQAEDTVEAFVKAYRALEAGRPPALCVDPKAGY